MKFYLALSTALVAIIDSVQAQTWTNWTNCATGATDLVVTSSSLDPLLCPGAPSCLTLQGSLSLPVTAGGKLNIIGRYVGKVIYTYTEDLCTLLASEGTPCPIATTATSIKVCPITKPNMPYMFPMAFTYQMTNGNGHVLACQASTMQANNYCNLPPWTPSATVAPITTTTTTTAATPSGTPLNGWTNCATGATDLAVTSASLAPSLCPGGPSCLTLQGSLSSPIVQGGKLTITGRYLGKIVYTYVEDLCTMLAAQGTPCPIATTATSIKICPVTKNTFFVNIPVIFTYQMTNGNGHVLACQSNTLTATNYCNPPASTTAATVAPTTTTTTTTTTADPNPTGAPLFYWANCASSATDMAVSSVTFGPPLCPEVKSCMTLQGSLAFPITTGSKLAIEGKYLGSVVYTDNLDLCTLLAEQGTPCPVATSVTSIKVCPETKMSMPSKTAINFQYVFTNGPSRGSVIACQGRTLASQNCLS